MRKLFNLILNRLTSYYNIDNPSHLDMDEATNNYIYLKKMLIKTPILSHNIMNKDMILINGEIFTVNICEYENFIVINVISDYKFLDSYRVEKFNYSMTIPNIISKYPLIRFERNKTIDDILNTF